MPHLLGKKARHLAHDSHSEIELNPQLHVTWVAVNANIASTAGIVKLDGLARTGRRKVVVDYRRLGVIERVE